MNPALFPMFVRLEGRRCLVVGGGPVAESKIESLLLSGAIVRVVAPQATARIEGWSREGRLAWEPREFAPADLEGMFLVVSAVSSPEVHHRVRREASSRAVLCNAVDDPGHSDFYYPAVVRRGALQVAISTGGRSPALARRLRQELEIHLGPLYGEWVERLGRVRQRLIERNMDPGRRQELLHRLASSERFELWKRRRRE